MAHSDPVTNAATSAATNPVTPARWDLVVVGAGPAGSATALAALRTEPRLRVLLIDRADFPRDKSCGDGVAPHVLDVLASLGVTGLLDDRVPVDRLQLRRGRTEVSRAMVRPGWVVPRSLLDARLVEVAVAAGATLRRHRVRAVRVEPDGVRVDDLCASVVVGADGAYSQVRRDLGLPGGRRAVAIRGYAPTSAGRQGRQVLAFAMRRQPAYAWSFDRGDGLANVGYGELRSTGVAPTRTLFLRNVEELLPGATAGATAWRAAHLPLSSWRIQQPDGPVLLTGDAAGLVNPVTGEGIYYAVATGAIAGRAAAQALADGSPSSAGARHRTGVRKLLAGHVRQTAAVSRLESLAPVVSAGVRAAAADQRFFDELVELGLGRGRLSPYAVSRWAAGLRGR